MNFLRKPLVLLLVLLSCSCGGGGGEPDVVPQRNACDDIQLNAKIIDGTACQMPERSAVTRLVLVDAAGKQAYCTGVLLSSTKILTAAHCFEDSPVRVVAVHGEPLRTAGQYEAEGWVLHPNRRSEGLYIVNDVAIVLLAEPIEAPVLPLLIRTSVPKGAVVSIFGYGQDEAGTFDFEELKSGEMKVAAAERDYLRADFFGEGSNTCLGDSGGPLLYTVDGVAAVAGITSTGQREDCLANDQSFFVNLQSVAILNFIQEIVPEAQYH